MLIQQQWPEVPAPIDAAVFYQGTMSSLPLLLASVLILLPEIHFKIII